jgi:hypothetical protein
LKFVVVGSSGHPLTVRVQPGGCLHDGRANLFFFSVFRPPPWSRDRSYSATNDKKKERWQERERGTGRGGGKVRTTGTWRNKRQSGGGRVPKSKVIEPKDVRNIYHSKKGEEGAAAEAAKEEEEEELSCSR